MIIWILFCAILSRTIALWWKRQFCVRAKNQWFFCILIEQFCNCVFVCYVPINSIWFANYWMCWLRSGALNVSIGSHKCKLSNSRTLTIIYCWLLNVCACVLFSVLFHLCVVFSITQVVKVHAIWLILCIKFGVNS